MFATNSLSANVWDNLNLSNVTLVTNETGFWKNITGQYSSPTIIANGTNTLVTFNWSNSSIEGGTTVGWYLLLIDNSSNINVTRQLNFTVAATVSLSTIIDNVTFGQLSAGQSNWTENSVAGMPRPFIIRNDGNVHLNITVGASDLFITDVNPTANFRFNVTENEIGATLRLDDLVSVWTNMFVASQAGWLANNTNFTDWADELQVHINITVPAAEPGGYRNTTVTFTASQAYRV